MPGKQKSKVFLRAKKKTIVLCEVGPQFAVRYSDFFFKTVRYIQSIYHFEGESSHNMEVVQTKQDRPSISQYLCPKGRIMHIFHYFMTIFRITKMLRIRHLQTIYHFEGESPHNMEVFKLSKIGPQYLSIHAPRAELCIFSTIS